MFIILIISAICMSFCAIGILVQVSIYLRTIVLFQKAQGIYDAARRSAGYVYSTVGHTPSSYTTSLDGDSQQFMTGSNIPKNMGDIDGLPPEIRADLEELFSFDWGDGPPRQPLE